MDIAAKLVHFAQQTRHFNQLFHGVIRRADDPGAQKQPAHAIATVEVQGQGDHFFRRKARAGHITGAAIDAVLAVIQTKVGQQDFQQRNAAPVRRIAVADAHAIGGTQAGFVLRTALGCATAGARRVVLGGVGQYTELVDELHEVPLNCLDVQYRVVRADSSSLTLIRPKVDARVSSAAAANLNVIL